MKKILAFVKANLVSVICVVVAILALPVLVFLSAGKMSKIQEDVQGDINGKARTLQQVEYSYVFEPVTPDDERIEFKRTPNEKTNAAMDAWGKQLRVQADSATSLLVDRNSNGKRVLLEGLLPAPEESEKVSKLQEIVSIWPVAHEALLRRAKAGLAPDAATVSAVLNTQWAQRIEQIQSRLGESITEDDYDQIRSELSKDRLSMYRAAAADLRFYIEPDAIKDVIPWGSNALPPMDLIWDWQWRHWIHADLIEALRMANTDDGWERSLLEGPVKHLESIEITPWSYSGAAPEAPISFADEIAVDWNASLSGRSGWPGAVQGLYDVRNATVTVIIDSSRINRVIKAFNSTNLMRVVDIHATEFDASNQLNKGYVYGSGHLIRATLTVETVWLRSWMKQYMPAEVRNAMGIPADIDPELSDADMAESE